MKHELPEDLPGRLLRAGQPGPRPVPPPPDALLGAVRDAMEGARRRARLRVGALVALAAGLAAAGAWFGFSLRGAPPRAAVESLSGMAVLTPQGGQAVALSAGMPVEEGARIVTMQGGSAQLKLRSGTELAVGASAELEVQGLADHQRFRLAAGRATVHVRPLARGQRFVLSTEDAELEVHGTRFEVESTQVDAACDVATATRVAVFEGRVVVRHGADVVSLEAPAHWPECGATGQLAPDVVPEQEATLEAQPPPAPAPRKEQRASLNELNARYREAIAAKRRGDSKRALELFQQFYERYPHSQLAEAARVEALRLLGRTDVEAARAAAKEYLARHPRGFARDEAKALLEP